MILYEVLSVPRPARIVGAGEGARKPAGVKESGGRGGSSVVMRSLLPINSLRNAALLGADTSLVAMVDVDLLLSTGLSRQLSQLIPQDLQSRPRINNPGGSSSGGSLAPLGRSESSLGNGRVWILPAFETLPRLGIDAGIKVAEDATAGMGSDLVQEAIRGGYKAAGEGRQGFASGIDSSRVP